MEAIVYILPNDAAPQFLYKLTPSILVHSWKRVPLGLGQHSNFVKLVLIQFHMEFLNATGLMSIQLWTKVSLTEFVNILEFINISSKNMCIICKLLLWQVRNLASAQVLVPGHWSKIMLRSCTGIPSIQVSFSAWVNGTPILTLSEFWCEYSGKRCDYISTQRESYLGHQVWT